MKESILSLLLKLHDKLVGTANSYKPSQSRLDACKEKEDSRIGDGVFFVAKVLDKACLASDINFTVVKQLYQAKVNEQSASDGGETSGCSSDEKYVNGVCT